MEPVITKYEIYTRTSPDASGKFLFVDSATNPPTLSKYPQADFYVPILLDRNVSMNYYVDVSKDPSIFVISRQNINPYFIEFSFFNTVQNNSVNMGSNLTVPEINYIKSVQPTLSGMTNVQVQTWFQYTGYSDLPWSSGTITADVISDAAYDPTNLVSKANHFNITINS